MYYNDAAICIYVLIGENVEMIRKYKAKLKRRRKHKTEIYAASVLRFLVYVSHRHCLMKDFDTLKAQ